MDSETTRRDTACGSQLEQLLDQVCWGREEKRRGEERSMGWIWPVDHPRATGLDDSDTLNLVQQTV